MSEVAAAEWEAFLKGCSTVHILQSAAWGELKAAFGWQVCRLISDDQTGQQIGAQILFRPGPLGLKIAYLGRGPVCAHTQVDPAALSASIWPEVDAFCRAKRAIFLLVEPDIWESEPSQPVDIGMEGGARPAQPGLLPGYTPQGFLPGGQTIQPARTILLDLSAGEERLLQQMKQKTRYNIRLSEKKGVHVSASNDLATFHRLMILTGERDGFAVHSLEYYQKAYQLFHPSGMCELFIARYQDEPLAALLVFAYQKRAWYFYGASSDAHRDLMPNYLAQWHAIQWAIEKGCAEYDLWGVPDENLATLEEGFQSRSDGLWGVYRFKRGFGGQLKRSAGPWDRVYQPAAYRLYHGWLRLRQRGLNPA